MSVIYRALRKLDKDNRQASPGGEVLPPKQPSVLPSPLVLRLAVGGVSLLAGAGMAWYFLAHRNAEPLPEMTPVAATPGESRPAAPTITMPPAAMPVTTPAAPPPVTAPPSLAPPVAVVALAPPVAAPVPVALAPPPPERPEREVASPAESLPVAEAASPAPEAVAEAPARPAMAAEGRQVHDGQVRTLVKEVREAVQRRDQKGVTRGLDSLTRTLGKESVTVQKLRAFWLMQVAEYPSAEQLWKKVLARNPGDIDAGLNLALVEVLTGRLAQGRERLALLAQDYPEDPRVLEFYRKIKER